MFYDLYVPGFENYLANGLVSHNCGLGKSLMALVWCENAMRASGRRRSLIVAPLAVSRQLVREADKFGLKAAVTQDGTLHRGVNVTNYERLKNYRPEDFCAVDFDESSILKGIDGKTRREATEFMRGVPYRLLCSATPAPNDFMELGGSCEALGVMKHSQMLGTFFTNGGDDTQSWRLKGHAKGAFWRWAAGWARAVRKPSDLGYDDAGYDLPPLKVVTHTVGGDLHRRRGKLLPEVARSLNDQRAEMRRTLKERCQRAAEIAGRDGQCVIWCHLNDEADTLQGMIPGSVQVAGSDSDRDKEDRLLGFADGKYRVLITKPKIAGFGMNWQNCARVVYFVSHSHEQYYQAVRRCWRFGQPSEVECHLISSPGLAPVLANMVRKERQSAEMYDGIVRRMHDAVRWQEETAHTLMRLPKWLAYPTK